MAEFSATVRVFLLGAALALLLIVMFEQKGAERCAPQPGPEFFQPIVVYRHSRRVEHWPYGYRARASSCKLFEHYVKGVGMRHRGPHPASGADECCFLC